MLCHRKSRGVVAYALQMLTNATPETSPSFADVDMAASAAGDIVHKIFRSAGEMITDGEGAFRALYILTRLAGSPMARDLEKKRITRVMSLQRVGKVRGSSRWDTDGHHPALRTLTRLAGSPMTRAHY